MEAKLRKPELLQRVLAAVEDGGWSTLVLRAEHPFRLRLFRDETTERIDLTVYIWNITHGGGAARPADELRIQLTGAVPFVQPEGQTVLLGWNEGYRVFVAFDLRRHAAQASASPSIQVARSALLRAHTNSFATYTRGNREVVVAFRPEYFVEYVRSAATLHSTDFAQGPLPQIVNALDAATDAQIDALPATPRRTTVQTLKRKYREHDFAVRVLTAYAHRCALCGVQLKLVEAAHIVPVAADGSTDETTNGVALCALHHRAFDANLVSFNERYEVEVGERRVERLRSADLARGLREFRKALLPALILPADRRDYPAKDYIERARSLRRWEA
jgi:putative restriction endonuclease